MVIMILLYTKYGTPVVLFSMIYCTLVVTGTASPMLLRGSGSNPPPEVACFTYSIIRTSSILSNLVVSVSYYSRKLSF